MKTLIPVLLLATAASSAFAAEGNMVGNQTQNEGFSIVPRKAPVVLDGDFSEWDLSGQIWSFADWDCRDTFSVKTAAMWDEDFLYLAFDWRDPLPLNSQVNPLENPTSGWQTDAIQLRSLTPDGLAVWITMWPYQGDKPALDVEYWDPSEKRDTKPMRKLHYTGRPKDWELGSGIGIAYRLADDGRGFTQEVRLPWSLFQPDAEKPSVAAGDVRKLGVEFYWANPSGAGWPLHSYKDNLQPGVLTREFFWTAVRAWGDATLCAQGDVSKRTYKRKIIRPEGTIALRAEVPAGSEFFSVVVDDADGRRIRNVAGGYRTEDFTVGEANGNPVVEVLWDGLDETGALVKEGDYRLATLGSGPIDGWWETSFYNPGHPAWETGDGRGSWAADHCPVSRIALAGTNLVLCSAFAEGGSATIGVSPDGVKLWSEKRGTYPLAANSRHVFIIPNDWAKQTRQIARLNAETGAYLPFREGGEMPMKLEEFLRLGPGEKAPHVRALAATDSALYFLLGDDTLRVFDPATGEPGRVYRLADLQAAGDPVPVQPEGAAAEDPVPFAADASAVYFTSGADVCRLDLASGRASRLALRDTLGRPAGLAFDAAGFLYIADAGPDSQVKKFDLATGKLVQRFGRKGGRARSGPFDPKGMLGLSAVAVDASGRVWVAENQRSPRRVSVWSPKGSFVRDFIGNSGYAAEFTFIHANDPTLAYAEMNEIKVDPATGDWKVLGSLYNPDPAKGLFAIPGSTPFHTGDVYESAASGRKREYFSVAGWNRESGFLMLMRAGRSWETVAAITTVGRVRKALAPDAEEWKSRKDNDPVLWNDFDNDGYIQLSECELPADEDGVPVSLSAMGNAQTDTGDLGVFVTSTHSGTRKRTWGRLLPVSFRDGGKPVYFMRGYRPYDVDWEATDAATAIPGRDLVVGFYKRHNHAFLAGWRKSDAAILWSYASPFHNVHGSHDAPMPRPGLLIGCLKVMGVAPGCGDSDVVMVRGNLGEDYFVTADGFFVNRFTRDCRLPGPLMPTDPAVLRKTSLSTLNGRGEPFSGVFTRHRDGVVRASGPIPANQGGNIIRIEGLDSVRHGPVSTFAVSTADLVKAEADNLRRAQELARPVNPVKVARVQFKDDGSPDLGKTERAEIRSEGQAVHADFHAAYDAERLYLRWDVFGDDSPWKNTGKDWRILFKTGDCVDVQLSPSANKTTNAAEGDLRLLVAPFVDSAAVVLMRPKKAGAASEEAYTYSSPVQSAPFDSVVRLDVQPDIRVRERDVRVQLSIAWSDLGLEAPASGAAWRGDVGLIVSDAAGTVDIARVYRANKHTNLVNDQPGEALLQPVGWSGVVFE